MEILVNRIYKHFKGDHYLVLALARHSETDEKYVVYRELYAPYEVWVRPASLFLDVLDKEKYPNILQERRFELVDIKSVR
ncbi:MAG: DUF1653 domain-containing protein [Ruminococcaceae bacterium]|nr:DUF1653 domain-containing protein [Oscillospiraceae bacterium]